MKKNKTQLIHISGSCFVIFTIFFALFCFGTVTAEPASNLSKTQLLLYIVGSDLESSKGDATNDILEILDSYGKVDLQKFDILVAFGGANKPGWYGMKIATIDELITDSKDGSFGNGAKYEYTDPGADMGKGESLEKFIVFAKENRPAERRILVLSDHGNSYQGIGVDEVTGNQLQMSDINSALSAGGLEFNPVMFDACLMASIEVAKTVNPYTPFIIGSEEVQYGSYNYMDLVGPLVQNPLTDTDTLAKGIIDSYIRRPISGPKVKTMSIIDTRSIPAIRESLNVLGEKLLPISKTDEGFYDLKGAFNNAVRFGVTDGDAGTSIDLVSLLENIEKKRPELSEDIKKTIDLINKAVLYEKHNEYSQIVHGISIASPEAMTLDEYNKFGEGVKIAPYWDEFFIRFLKTSDGSLSDAEMAQTPKAIEEVLYDSEKGNSVKSSGNSTYASPGFQSKGNGSIELTDPYGDASIFLTYYLINGTKALSLGSDPIQPDINGLYSIPTWDGRWYYIPDTTKKGQPLFLDMEYDSETSGGFKTYYSWVDVIKKGKITNESVITFVDKDRKKIETILNPYYETASGSYLFGDGFSLKDLKKDDTVISYSTGFDIKTGKKEEYTISTTKPGDKAGIKYKVLPDGTYAAGLSAYYDLEDEVLTNEFRIITLKNGAVVNTSLGMLN